MWRNRAKRLFARQFLCPGLLGLILSGSYAHSQQATRNNKKIQTAPSPLAAAKSQFDQGDLDAADRTLLELLSSQPADIPALPLLGLVRARQERFPEAEALFRRILQSEPNSLVAQRNLALSLIAQGKLNDASSLYDAAIQANP